MLLTQLDVPAGQGVLITQVLPDTPAAKAGLKSNDILLKIGGAAIPSDIEAVGKIVRELKAGEARTWSCCGRASDHAEGADLAGRAEAEALRVEEKKEGEAAKPEGDDTPAEEGRGSDSGKKKADMPTLSMMSTNVTNNEFRIKAVSGETIYVMNGKFDGGKPVPASIVITTGGEEKKEYATFDKVPERTRRR